MELYGGNLHLLCTFTGGFILHRNDLWPNLVKISVLAIFCILYYILLSFDFGLVGRLVISTIVPFIVLTIQLIVVYLNKILDKSIDLPDIEQELNDEPELPRGVSAQLWSRRMVLFDQTLPADERAYRLIQEGFDPEEVFRLNALIESGEINEHTEIGARSHRIKKKLILINGTVANIQLDRETLSRTFIRPPNWFYILLSFLLSFIMTFFVYVLKDFSTKVSALYLMFIPATAIFSFLLPPSCDPYSTTLNDPYIAFTRAITLSIFTFFIAELDSLDQKFQSSDSNLSVSAFINVSKFLNITHENYVEYQEMLANFCAILPFLIFVGFIGHPLITFHYFIEVVSKYIFGLAGSASFFGSLIELSLSIVHFFISFGILKISSNFVSITVMIIYVSFFVQFCYEDILSKRIIKPMLILSRFIKAMISGVAALLAYFIHIKQFKIIPITMTTFHIIIDLILPYITSHQSYFLLHGKLMDTNKTFNLIRKYFGHVTVPFFLSYLLQNYPLDNILSPLLVIQCLNISQSVPHIYAVALILATFTLPNEFSFQNLSISLLISLLISRKLIKIENIIRLRVKSYFYPEILYSDPYTNPLKFIWATVISFLKILSPHLSTSFSFGSIVWSCITGAPNSIFFGLGPYLLPSAPRPNLFYDESSKSFESEPSFNIAPNHPIEAPVYVSLTKSLEKSLYSLIKSAKLGIVNDDSFYLLVDNDLVSILHIISVVPGCVRFQIRGLEYEQQTICHNGELSILQQIVLEQTESIGNFGHAIAFHFSMFDLVAKNLELNMISVSQFNFNRTVFSVLGETEVFNWLFKALAYIAAKEQIEFSDHDQLENDMSELSQENIDFINIVFHYFEKLQDSRTVRNILESYKYIFENLKSENGLDDSKLLSFFNGNAENVEDENIKALIIKGVRYGVLLCLNASVDLAPSIEDLQDFFDFMHESEEQLVLPVSDENFLEQVGKTESALISLVNVENAASIVRFGKSSMSWAVFKLETESVRGFWANESRNILFDAIISNERPSIQFNIHFLRNITNQSCNQPIGYPVVVSNINVSYE
ncbi:hypothetical protein TRFO_01003 [Tritrichomonas foetus]|uniref:Pecanex C-terminal domain-containing protein n=1 Tax=Tritrichomonas foetus TaxID=1144522 RepID=A0A1J4L6X5_9EUKA|nr:hypothetical protein TRFO_01003 [Tritrichomonas foetus]|eukprot:OHT17694.1 hypothetical protein TRFO_01003 [Tritrichomonas foetus]